LKKSSYFLSGHRTEAAESLVCVGGRGGEKKRVKTNCLPRDAKIYSFFMGGMKELTDIKMPERKRHAKGRREGKGGGGIRKKKANGHKKEAGGGLGEYRKRDLLVCVG